MSDVGKAFKAAFGRPEPETPSGVTFTSSFFRDRWKRLHREVRSGWFEDRFLYLFGEGLGRLEACLAAWSFLVPPNGDRQVLGYNAHGSLLVLHDANTPEASVHVLDPFRVAYWTNPNLAFVNLIGHWLPEDQLPHFRERAVYDAWRAKSGGPLDEGEILAPRRPEGLGGAFALDNFQEEEIVSFYETTAPIYARAFEQMGRPRPGAGPPAPATRPPPAPRQRPARGRKGRS